MTGRYFKTFHPLIAASLLGLAFSWTVEAQDAKHAALDSPFGTYVEKNAPFFSSVLDARKIGKDWPADNLTPRGIILNLDHGIHACFDTDLLRVALVWKENEQGEYLTMNGMAPGSYRRPNQKSPSGQTHLPKPIGEPILANGLYPGWITGGDASSFTDPREKSVDSAETGLGPLPVNLGRWTGIRLNGNLTILTYSINGVGIEQITRAITETDSDSTHLRIDLRIQPHPDQPLTLGLSRGLHHVIQVIPPSKKIATHSLTLPLDPKLLKGLTPGAYLVKRNNAAAQLFDSRPNKKHWQQAITTRGILSPEKTAFLAKDEIPLPVPNPWKRNVRLSGFDFFSDGRAAFCTFDGDIWIADGLVEDLETVTWKRFASGLHEPMSLEIVDDEIFVFDRNGIVRLHDKNKDGEADFYENFCNLVAQTAESREFAMDMQAKPGGGFYLAKGGQVGTTRGKYNGTVVEVAADGKSFDVIATGLRQPYLGVDPQTGLVTASDQQGHWVPSTPIHVIEPGGYYGFQPAKFKDKAIHSKPITEPAVWIPHFVNQSGASQLWLRNAKMGALNDSLIHIGYNRPEIFRVYLDRGSKNGSKVQGAVVPLLKDLQTGTQKGRVHPIDGSLYLAGFKIWGTMGKDISGFYRLRHGGGRSSVPANVLSDKRGILLRFDSPVDAAAATQLSNYTIDRWNYRRTHNYGSGHYKPGGEPGQETLPPSSVYLSGDKKSVFLGVPGMQAVHSLRVTWRQAGSTGQPEIQSAYLTIHELRELDLAGFDFGNLDVDLTVRSGAGQTEKAIQPSAKLGKLTAEQFGCIACHTTDGSKAIAAEPNQVVGPTWKGLFGSKRNFADGTTLKAADEVYLRESIIDPSRKVSAGFETSKTGVGMPSYLGVLKDRQIDSIVLYIRSLARAPGKRRSPKP